MCTSVYFGWGILGNMQVKILERWKKVRHEESPNADTLRFKEERSYLGLHNETVVIIKKMMKHTMAVQIPHIQSMLMTVCSSGSENK